MRRLVATLAVTAVLAAASPDARARDRDRDRDVVGALGQAQAHLLAGEYAEATRLARPIARDDRVARPDRAEAWRIYGLALYLMGLEEEADAALFEYLKLEPDAHLDPALVPPEAIVFFEAVRARHAAELERYRPRPPPRRRFAALNLLPPAGQFQNRQPAKGWAIGLTEVALLATNVTTYVLLRDMCGVDCGEDPSTARTLKTVNLISGGLFLGVVLYGVVDGFLVYRRQGAEERAGVPFAVAPVDGGGLTFHWVGDF